MAFTDYIITDAEVSSVHVEAQPTVLRGSAQQNKKVFDAYSDLIKGKHNQLCNEIASSVEPTIDPLVLGLYASLGWTPDE